MYLDTLLSNCMSKLLCLGRLHSAIVSIFQDLPKPSLICKTMIIKFGRVEQQTP